jgi:hypothetical protein
MAQVNRYMTAEQGADTAVQSAERPGDTPKEHQRRAWLHRCTKRQPAVD